MQVRVEQNLELVTCELVTYWIMEIVEKPRIGVVGGGSWATAIAKMLTENNGHINWFMRNIESIKAFKVLKHNPRYLCGVDFDIDRISFSDDLDWVIMNSDVIVFAIPSAFLQNVVTPRLQVSLKDKIVRMKICLSGSSSTRSTGCLLARS